MRFCNQILTITTPMRLYLLRREEFESMRYCEPIILCSLLSVGVSIGAQQKEPATQVSAAVKPVRTAYYVDPMILNIGALLPPPPAVDSREVRADLAELHRIEQARTSEQAAKAKADEDEEDMFAFKTVFGPGFTPEALPVTAALGMHVKNEQSVVGNQLKLYQRPRPYQSDHTLHPVCELKTQHDSYPSGHGLTGLPGSIYSGGDRPRETRRDPRPRRRLCP